MSALPEALPFALAAAFYPPAILVLILLLASEQPRRLVLSYFAGAALIVAVVGIGGIFLLEGAQATTRQNRSLSAGLDLALGVLLFVVGAVAWSRRERLARRGRDKPAKEDGRLQDWTRRATASVRWAFALGVLMYLPSPLYLVAIKDIADSGGSNAGRIAAVLICGACVLLFVMVPALALLVGPDEVQARLEAFRDWLGRNGWALAAVLAIVGGAVIALKGIVDLV